ncbi:hypothetical protein BC567DRAFT_253373 [Phyllosticta citribraziliensis]
MQSCIHQLYEWGRILAIRTDPKTYHSPFWPWFRRDPTPEIMRQILEQQSPTKHEEDQEQVPMLPPPPSLAITRLPTPEPPLFPSVLFNQIEHTASGPDAGRAPAVEHDNMTGAGRNNNDKDVEEEEEKEEEEKEEKEEEL